MTEMPSTAHFVLVHGLSLGAWCWYKIRCLMESSGYKVTCLDLKSAGSDITDPDTVLTFEDYHQPLYHFFSTLPENEKVIIVGHSAGGISVTDSMYKYPRKVKAVVYVAAPMLKHGFSTPQDIKDETPDLSKYGDVSEYGYGFGPNEPPTSVKLKKEFQRQILFNTSPLEDSTLASMVIRRGPSRPFRDKTCPTDNVNLTPFNAWRSAYYCLENLSKDICPKYALNQTGWLNVTHNDGEEFCKGGCADHTRAVLECLYDVKRDYWFANKAKVHHLNDTINIGCNTDQGFNGTSLYPSSGYKMKSISIFLSISAFVFMALF